MREKARPSQNLLPSKLTIRIAVISPKREFKRNFFFRLLDLISNRS